MRILELGCLSALALLTTTPHVGMAQSARFDVPRDTALLDARLRIALTGVPASRYVAIRMSGVGQTARATFVADKTGIVDLTRDAPVSGSYSKVNAMGLFWSAGREGGPLPPGARPNRAAMNATGPIPFQLTAELDGAIIATDTVWRRAVAAGVRVTPMRDAGFVGVLYEPAESGRHPAVVVLGGSAGGTTPAAGFPGGLASRGYVVLSLAYFNEEGLPPSLSNIPLEYFERALTWLRVRPSVDSARVGVLGGSRGGEAALLIAATYPRLVQAVAAFVPSSVVWNGCCDATVRLGPAWTLKGKPVPFIPPDTALEDELTEISRAAPVRNAPLMAHKLADPAAAARSAIPVERIAGPVLLVSARDDGVWPSYDMALQIVARLKQHAFAHPYRHLAYDGAGHALFARPYISVTPLADANPATGRRIDSGGIPAMTERAREESWAELLAFLDAHLRRKK